MYFSEHFQNLITLKILPLRINTLIPPLFPLFRTVLELLQSDSLQCLRRFFPHLIYILKVLSFKVPLHSWKQEKIAGCQICGVGGVRSRCYPVFREKLPHTQCCVGGALWSSESQRGMNFAATRFMWSSPVKIRWHELHETPVSASNLLIVRRESNVIASRIFWMFSSFLLVEGRPDRGWSSSDMSPRLNWGNHS